MAKRTRRNRSAAKEAAANRKSNGLNLKTVVGVVMLIIGALLVLFNLAGILYAVVGLALIYFGVKILGGWNSSLIDLHG